MAVSWISGADHVNPSFEYRMIISQGSFQAVLKILPSQTIPVFRDQMKMPDIDDNTPVDLSEKVVGVFVKLVDNRVIIIEKSYVVIDKRILVLLAGQIQLIIYTPVLTWTKHETDFRYLITFGAQLLERFEQVGPLPEKAFVFIDNYHVDICGHDLFDLTLPPIRFTGPIFSPFER